jgi:protein-tyrosine phosphatase
MTNWIPLDGAVNTRDLGGTPTAGGGSVQPGRLVRSDNLQDLSAADVQTLLEEYGITDVIDLRSDVEVFVTGPSPIQDRISYHHLSLFRSEDLSEHDAGAEALVLPWARGEDEKLDEHAQTSHYLGYLAARPDSVSNALRVIADAPGASIVHCAAGKDRAGTITALALSVAGVDDEAIAADYTASDEKLEAILARLNTVPMYASNLQGKGRDQQAPDPQTMPRLLASLRREYGSVAGWLISQGWTEAEIERLRAKLTAP